MLRSSFDCVTIKLFILLALCCLIQADCGLLTVRHGYTVINRDSVCVKKYRTSDCSQFYESFDQSELPVDFPRNSVPVEAPSDINVVGLDYIYEEKTIYPGISVEWKSPLSGTARQNCFGYLIGWYYEGSSSRFCQLFKLNSSNPILAQQLQYQYNISIVEEFSSYTVEVYSMPPHSREQRHNKNTFVSMPFESSLIREVVNLNMEPANWYPHIAHKIFDNGTIIAKFALPPPHLNLTRFSVLLTNQLNLGKAIFEVDYRPPVYSMQNPYGVQKFNVSDSGCYQIVIWVMEEEGFHRVQGKCSCWIFTNGEKVCKNTCGGSSIKFCTKVTSQPNVYATNTFELTNTLQMITTTMPAHSPQKAAVYNPIFAVIALGLFVLMIVIIIASLIICSLDINFKFCD